MGSEEQTEAFVSKEVGEGVVLVKKGMTLTVWTDVICDFETRRLETEIAILDVQGAVGTAAICKRAGAGSGAFLCFAKSHAPSAVQPLLVGSVGDLAGSIAQRSTIPDWHTLHKK